MCVPKSAIQLMHSMLLYSRDSQQDAHMLPLEKSLESNKSSITWTNAGAASKNLFSSRFHLWFRLIRQATDIRCAPWLRSDPQSCSESASAASSARGCKKLSGCEVHFGSDVALDSLASSEFGGKIFLVLQKTDKVSLLWNISHATSSYQSDVADI